MLFLRNIFLFNINLILFCSFSVVTSGSGLDVEDQTVKSHDVSKWNDNNKEIELTEAVVNGLAATSMKMSIPVSPKTKVVKFEFYKWITEFLKTLSGQKTVRLASIIIHYKPHSDSCKGTVSYALVDKRFLGDKMKTESKAKLNDKPSSDYSVVGQVKQLVTLRCNEEAVVQMSMNHFVSVEDINKIKLVQIVSGIDMHTGNLATINIGWKTIPGEATVYQYYPAQKYTIPRMKMPELVGKSSEYVYNKLVHMAKVRHDREVAMLNQLQTFIDQQDVVNNDLEVDTQNQINEIENKIQRYQQEINKIDEIIPQTQQLAEKNMKLKELEKIRQQRFLEYNKIKNEPVIEEVDEMKFETVNPDFPKY
uniref:Putative movement protein n=1 Tax=Emaravirus tritici TaxID=1980428 RepID=A0A7T8I138_9VIRU|nr:putative movement protein [Emaravirus tritici]